MPNKPLNLEPLDQALHALKQSIDITTQFSNDPSTTIAHKATLQAGVIQHFEFCYELSWKILKRYLSLETPAPELIDTMSFQELIREGAQKGVIKNAEKWLSYRHKRNMTSHTYHAETAAIVYKTTLAFYQDAFALLSKLKEKQHDQS